MNDDDRPLRPHPDWTRAHVRAHADAEEDRTGYDGVTTIERVYDTTGAGAYRCCFPDCLFTRRDAVAMWLHVHFSPRHQL